MDNEEQEIIHPCICDISNLKCKNEKCQLLKTSRQIFKNEACKMLYSLMSSLRANEYSRKECIRALRRELNYRNNLNQDMFDEVADQIWGSKHHE